MALARIFGAYDEWALNSLLSKEMDNNLKNSLLANTVFALAYVIY